MQSAEVIISKITIITSIGSLLAFFIIFFLFHYNKKRNQQKETFDRELLLAQLEMQEQTFQRIAEELHDNVGQLLALAKLNLSIWEMDQESEEAKINDAIKIIGYSIEEIRNLSKGLNVNYVSHNGLFYMVENFVEQLRKVQQFTVNLSLKGKIISLGDDKEMMLFRIIQESFHNIIKHSDAKTIFLSFFYMQNKLELKIRDDGLGFNVTETLKRSYENGASGLQNILRRVKAMNARYELTSNNNKGTLLCITIPI